MDLHYAIPASNKIEAYEKMMKEWFVAELTSHGYEQGFDFSKAAKIEVNELKHYAVPHYDGLILPYQYFIYIPVGVKFERFFELSFVEFEGKLHINKRDRDDYDYLEPKGSSYEEIKAKINQLQNKGPYPGVEYFRDELRRLDESLKQHKPLIPLDFTRSMVLDKLPVYARIYQLSEKEVRMHLSFDDSPTIFPGVEITYNLETGEVSDLTRIPPPSLN